MNDIEADTLESKYYYFYEIFEKDSEDLESSPYNNDDINKFTWSEVV